MSDDFIDNLSDEPEDAEEVSEETESEEPEGVEVGEESEEAPEPEDLDMAAYGDKKIAVKVDGDETKLPIKDIVAGYQKTQAANQRFEEAAKLRKEAEGKVSSAKDFFEKLTDPSKMYAMFRRTGYADAFETAAIEHVARLVELEKKSPEAKRAWELEQRMQDYEEKENMTRQQREAAAALEATQRAEQEITGWISSAIGVLEGVAGSPHQSLIERQVVAALLPVADKREITAEDVADAVASAYDLVKPFVQAPEPKKKPKIPGKAPEAGSNKKAKKRQKRLTVNQFFDQFED